ncbi:MAG: helix-turn-helix domain-containing protein, partial [Thermodesulfobacteriota bacterium]
GPEDLLQGLEEDTGKNQALESGDGDQVEEAVRQWVNREMASYPGENLFDHLTDRFGSILIKEALSLTNGNRTRAAKILGLSRPTLLSKIQKFGLKIEASIS